VGASSEDKVDGWAVADWWRPFTHAAGIAAVEDAELAAVCDVDEAAAAEAMKRYGAKARYTDYREMLAREALDVVAVATRTEHRVAIVEEAVRQGVRGVYCEKPLCNMLEEGDRLIALLEARGIAFVYGTRRRYMPAYRQAREAVHRGVVGELTTIVVRFGYGSLLWTHPHSVDIAAYFADDIDVAWVQADLDLDPAGVTDDVVDADPAVRMGCVRFVNGVTAHIVASDSLDVELSGRLGMMTVRSDGSSVRLRRRQSAADDGWLLEDVAIDVPDRTSGTVNGIRALVAAIRDGKDPDYDVRRAVRSQEILFGWLESHRRGGARVELPLVRRNVRITGRRGALLA
jgi:predicted dehydrogenase